MSDVHFSIENFYDDLGPEKIIFIHDPASGLRAIVVIDNTACGPAIGGLRMAADVSVTEVFRLARAMTLKNAAAGLPHGGGKSAIIADSRTPDKERSIRTFARAIRQVTDYIPGPDMGTDEGCMAWVRDEIGRAVGLPRVLGGIPLDEIGATGFGLAHCADAAASFAQIDLHRATLAVEGFGSVGQHAARFLAERGVRLVAASDSRGAIYDPDGIDVDALIRIKRKGGSVTAFDRGQRLPPEDLLTLRCDILLPAARPDCIHAGNAAAIKARLILQGANIPATAEAEEALHRRGVLVVPDFIANAGGVICAAAEYRGDTETAALEQIAQKVRCNTRKTLARGQEQQITPRQAAVEMAAERVHAAAVFRRK